MQNPHSLATIKPNCSTYRIGLPGSPTPLHVELALWGTNQLTDHDICHDSSDDCNYHRHWMWSNL